MQRVKEWEPVNRDSHRTGPGLHKDFVRRLVEKTRVLILRSVRWSKFKVQEGCKLGLRRCK